MIEHRTSTWNAAVCIDANMTVPPLQHVLTLWLSCVSKLTTRYLSQWALWPARQLLYLNSLRSTKVLYHSRPLAELAAVLDS